MSQPTNSGFKELSLKQQWEAVRRGSSVIVPHARGSLALIVIPATVKGRTPARAGRLALWDGSAGRPEARGLGQLWTRGQVREREKRQGVWMKRVLCQCLTTL